MIVKMGRLKDDFLGGDESNSDDSDSSFSDMDDSSDNSGFDLDDSDSNDEANDAGPSASVNIPGGSGDVLALNEDDEEDEVVKAILRSRQPNKDHPPDIRLEDFIADISFHPANNLIALACMSGDVLLYRYTNEATDLVSTLELHIKACRDVEFSEDGKILLSTAKDKSILLTDVETENLTRLYENSHEDPVSTLTVIDENLFATGDDNGTVKLWDMRQKGDLPLFSLKEMEDYVSAMVTTSEKKYLACASGDGSLTTLNMTARRMHVQSEEYEQELTCLGLFKSETKLLAGDSKGRMYVFKWGEFGLHSDEFPSVTKKSMNCMVPLTENIVVTAGEDGILRATNLFPYHHLGIVGQHSMSVEGTDISNDGTLIASTSYDNDVKFWNVEYFETLNNEMSKKGSGKKQLKHNLPSSKVNNASDFFSGLC
ncbi:WD repeat-containing protein 55 homolog [Neodiprion pinetum]|uniref:WD repeat-containing protein 55 homolog n=1 Tax=Neodiprion pinetum TaxID=441929 RepID=UPI001EDF2C3D|nr:WD repeat-containing protein 55 homolog [Neodiprion pinetum]